MTKLREVYKCEICGNVVEVVHEGAPALVCCGEDMKKLSPKTTDTGNEKHVPVVEEKVNGVLIKVGDVEHPMEEKHYIKFIEVMTDDKVLRAELKPGQKPQAEFNVPLKNIKAVREYCTVHDLWENNL
ncbi:desulfoferrodoxin [Halothermothrix orenii]|uniref:Desulfoferrodoxin n=1 Tax=Halothermothrix orenii (strain H 168 / OCM 544 / DSM 9562) TaxID=373903 RepID=B8D261_HALOH|nr:desulfoferrodoxin [Halothermothrix orenii]ACL69288.1 desulfoferrodoxin [Halothermothrix orenii H 168]